MSIGNTIKMLLVSVVLCAGASSACAQGTDPPAETAAEITSTDELDLAERARALRGYFDRLSEFGFSGSVLVAVADRPIFATGYGLASREEKRPFLPSTIVTIGSITKPFTAAAILKLKEMGQLRVEDPISLYLDGVSGEKRQITVEHLLTHTSGLKRNGLEGGDFNLDASREAVLREALESDLVGSPGDSYSYSNLGYTLLAIIVEEASGVGYESFLHRYLLAPSGMYRTGYLIPIYDDKELAAGYRDDKRLEPVMKQPMLDDGPTWNLRGNGGLHSDPFDMYRWITALSNGEVLSAEDVQLMTDAHVGKGAGQGSYGYGWDVETYSGGRRDISHSGGNGYFAADLHWLPAEEAVFFVATNEAAPVNMARLSTTVRRILLDEDYNLPPRMISIPDSILRHYAGSYPIGQGDTIVVEPEEESLTLTARGDYAMQAVLGGAFGPVDERVQPYAATSGHVTEQEFNGDFVPKFEVMGGSVPVETLERYHSYDREVWDEQFGRFRGTTVVAAAGQRGEVKVILRLDFERGAAGQVHTWRDGRLANVSVIPDWRGFTMSRRAYPVSEGTFESFEMGSSLRVVARFLNDPDRPGRYSLVFPNDPTGIIGNGGLD